MQTERTEAVSVPPLPIADALVRWDRWQDAQGVREATRKARRLWVSRLFERAGLSHVEDLTPDATAEYVASLDDAPSTINKVLAAVRMFGEWAVANGRLEHEPTAGLRRRKEPARASGSRAMSEDEAARLIRAGLDSDAERDDGQSYGLAYAAMLGLGLRIGEAANLCADWIDRDAGAVVVTAEDGKSLRDDAVPCPPWLMAALLAQSEGRPADAPLFGIRGRMDHRRFYADCARAGIEVHGTKTRRKLTPHGCRKTFTTLYERMGAPRGVVEHVTRHKSLSLTSAVYIDKDHLEASEWCRKFPDLLAAARSMPELAPPPRTPGKHPIARKIAEKSEDALASPPNIGTVGESHPNAHPPRDGAGDADLGAAGVTDGRKGPPTPPSATFRRRKSHGEVAWQVYVSACRAELSAARRLRQALEAELFGSIRDPRGDSDASPDPNAAHDRGR